MHRNNKVENTASGILWDISPPLQLGYRVWVSDRQEALIARDGQERWKWKKQLLGVESQPVTTCPDDT